MISKLFGNYFNNQKRQSSYARNNEASASMASLKDIVHPKFPWLHMPDTTTLNEAIKHLDVLANDHKTMANGLCSDEGCEMCFYARQLLAPNFTKHVAQSSLHLRVQGRGADVLAFAMYFYMLGFRSQQMSTEVKELERLEKLTQ